MDTTIIIKTLKTSPYKYTFAAKVKDYLKKDIEGDAGEIIGQLRLALGDPGNEDISRPIKEVLRYFKRNIM
jgi:hypothetical protein